MPELPEVETTRRGISPFIEKQQITDVVVRESRLRWAVPNDLADHTIGQTISSVQRRGKYLLLYCQTGCVLIHLGMSGSLRIVNPNSEIKKHDHVDLVFGQHCLRYHDPRRFGCILWTTDVTEHSLIKVLGIEPLDSALTGHYLYQHARQRKIAVKSFIMDSHLLVGVGNIYASESLFLAGIRPTRAAGRISLARYEKLAESVKAVLQAAIMAGGTTLRDFTSSDGSPGYFSQQLRVYDRAGEPCLQCGTEIQQIVIGQRASYFCPRCQS